MEVGLSGPLAWVYLFIISSCRIRNIDNKIYKKKEFQKD